MKKVFATILLALACVTGVFAGETYAKKGMLIAPGDKVATLGFDFGLGINAGFEMALGKFNVGDLPFTFGAKALGGLLFLNGGMAYNVGAAGTLHFAWASLDLPEGLWWVKNIDTFIALGVGYAGVAVDGLGNYGGIGIIGQGGSSYFFSKNMAVTVAGGLGGSYVGILLKM